MAKKRSVAVLLLILVLDLMGFTLIFPLIPEMLSYYLRQTGGHPLDHWVPDFLRILLAVSPDFRTGSERSIVLFGGVLGALYSILQFLFSPFWGRLSDRVGRKPVLILTSLGLATSYLLWGVSTAFTFFILSRIVGGIMAGNLGVATAAMADLSDREGRTKSMGLVGAAFGVGFVIGPAMGGILSRVSLSWAPIPEGIFHPFSAAALASFLLSSASAVLNWFYLEESHPVEMRGTRPMRIEYPFQALSELKEPAFQHMLLLNFFFMLLFTSFEFTVTFLYALDFRLGPREIGLVFFYLGILLVFGQGFLVRRLSGVVSEKRMILAGFLLVSLALVPLALSAPAVGLSLLALCPIALGSALLQPSMAGLASRTITAEKQGLAMGSFRSMGSLARAFGPLFGAWLYGSMGILLTYSTLAGLLLLAFVFGLFLPDESA